MGRIGRVQENMIGWCGNEAASCIPSSRASMVLWSAVRFLMPSLHLPSEESLEFCAVSPRSIVCHPTIAADRAG